MSLHSRFTVPGFLWPHSDSDVYTFCQARVHRPWMALPPYPLQTRKLLTEF